MIIKTLRRLSNRKKLSLVGISILFFIAIATSLSIRQKQETRSRAATSGPLRVMSSNPRYFTDSTGRAIYLAGEHTWVNVQERSYNPTFNYNAYLDFMAGTGQNFMRMWHMAMKDHSPQPWVISGGKADFSQFDDAYFTRLRTRIQQARDRGIYVSVMLSDGGWSMQGDNCGQNYFNPANNVNGIGNGSCTDSLEGNEPAIQTIWHAYADKLIQTVDDLDNVIYEVINESVPSSIPWQKEMVNYMKSRTTKPVGMTCTIGAENEVFNSNSDWVSPCLEEDPPVATGTKVIISDGDHWGNVSVDNIWKSFTRGINIIAMDCNHTGCRAASNDFSVFDWDRTLGDTVRYGNKMNLAAMTPQGNLTSTGYALASPSVEYLVYQPDSGSFTVNLEAGTYDVEWFDTASGQSSSGGTVNGGGSQSFTPPFNGAAVLYLKNTSITGLPTSSLTTTPSIPIQPTFACIGSCPTNPLSPSPSMPLSSPTQPTAPSSNPPDASGTPPAQNNNPTSAGGNQQQQPGQQQGNGNFLGMIMQFILMILQLLAGLFGRGNS